MDPITLDHDAATPPYEQIRSQIAAQVADGRLPAGTKLETVRQTSLALGVAVNTVARAYKELESDGVVVTEGRRGTFVASAALAADVAAEARDAAVTFAHVVRRLGLTRAEATGLVERAWES